jgi:hypothetical protein
MLELQICRHVDVPLLGADEVQLKSATVFTVITREEAILNNFYSTVSRFVLFI